MPAIVRNAICLLNACSERRRQRKKFPELLTQLGLFHILDRFLLSLCRILNPTVKKTLKGGDGEIARWYRTFAEDLRTQVWFPTPMLGDSKPTVTPVPGGPHCYLHSNMHTCTHIHHKYNFRICNNNNNKTVSSFLSFPDDAGNSISKQINLAWGP